MGEHRDRLPRRLGLGSAGAHFQRGNAADAGCRSISRRSARGGARSVLREGVRQAAQLPEHAPRAWYAMHFFIMQTTEGLEQWRLWEEGMVVDGKAGDRKGSEWENRAINIPSVPAFAPDPISGIGYGAASGGHAANVLTQLGDAPSVAG